MFHLLPYFVKRLREDRVLLSPVDLRDHPMNEVEIYVVKLQLLKLLSKFTLNSAFLSITMPELSGDEEFFSLDASFEAFLERYSNLIFVLVDLSSVDVSVAMLKDGCLDDFDDVVSFVSSEGSETKLWDCETVI